MAFLVDFNYPIEDFSMPDSDLYGECEDCGRITAEWQLDQCQYGFCGRFSCRSCGFRCVHCRDFNPRSVALCRVHSNIAFPFCNDCKKRYCDECTDIKVTKVSVYYPVVPMFKGCFVAIKTADLSFVDIIFTAYMFVSIALIFRKIFGKICSYKNLMIKVLFSYTRDSSRRNRSRQIWCLWIINTSWIRTKRFHHQHVQTCTIVYLIRWSLKFSGLIKSNFSETSNKGWENEIEQNAWYHNKYQFISIFFFLSSFFFLSVQLLFEWHVQQVSGEGCKLGQQVFKVQQMQQQGTKVPTRDLPHHNKVLYSYGTRKFHPKRHKQECSTPPASKYG